MEPPMFLNASGGIITPVNSRYDWLLPVAPYFETVHLPVLTVDSSAPYGDHPENLLTLTVSSAAALTFFVDSVAGGSDTSGDGSFDNPWRSLKTAGDFLSCAQCMLTTAAPYIQVKIKGTVDYIDGDWGVLSLASTPVPLILTGWDGRCDLSLSESATYGAGYIFNAKVNTRLPNRTVFSDCILSRFGESGYASAIDCEFLPFSYYGDAYLSCAYNCSGDYAATRICLGGVYSSATVQHVYGTTIHASGAAATSRANLLFLASRRGWDGGSETAVNVNISARLSATVYDPNGYFFVAVSAGGSSFFRDCNMDITAVGSGHQAERIAAILNGARVVSGGSYKLNALASASNADVSSADAAASATVYLFDSYTVVQGISTVLSASAGATVNAPNGSAVSAEYLQMFDSGCSRIDSRIYYNGSVTVYHSSGGVCP